MFEDQVKCPFCEDNIFSSVKTLCRHVENDHIRKESFAQAKRPMIDYEDLGIPDERSTDFISSPEMNSPANTNSALVQKSKINKKVANLTGLNISE